MSKKSLIAEEAFRLFVLDGISNVSINDIINSLEITKGYFYHYYTSKDELITSIFEEYIKEYFENIIKEAEELDSVSKDRFVLLIKGILDYDTYLKELFEDSDVSYARFYCLLIEYSSRYDFVIDFRKNFYHSLISLLIDILEQGKEEKIIIRDIDSKESAFKILIMTEGMLAMNLVIKQMDLNYHCLAYIEKIYDSFCIDTREVSAS